MSMIIIAEVIIISISREIIERSYDHNQHFQ